MKLSTRWKNLDSCVYENMLGDRIHVSGKLIRRKGAHPFRIYGREPYYKIALKRTGGNEKRALMYVAEAYDRLVKGELR